MKKTLFFVFFLFIFLIFPVVASAHGGVEKRAGNILVTLFQTPLSPLVGENVTFSFILTDPSVSHRFVNKSAHLVVTQTAYNDPAKDKVVFTKTVTSDVNGTIDFSYSFPTTNYYDIDLQFGKANNEANTTGFLVQPRENLNSKVQEITLYLGISLMINFIFLTFWAIKRRKK